MDVGKRYSWKELEREKKLWISVVCVSYSMTFIVLRIVSFTRYIFSSTISVMLCNITDRKRQRKKNMDVSRMHQLQHYFHVLHIPSFTFYIFFNTVSCLAGNGTVITPVAGSIFGPLFQTHISKREFKNEILRSALLDIQLTLCLWSGFISP